MTKRLLFQLLVIALVVVLLGLSGFADADEAEFEAALYCTNVASGVWPDYANSYKEDCKDILTKH